MPIRISQKLKRELPENQRKGLDTYLWKQSNGKCYLCGDKFNKTKDMIEADHVEPQAEKGIKARSRANLALAHRDCNSFKSSHSSIRVAPFLKFKRFLEKRDFIAQYGECQEHFSIKPKKIHIDINRKARTAKFHLGDAVREVPVFKEEVGDRTYKYCFVEVPRDALFNDDKCQPRTIKPNQVLAIYTDISHNPLHEPPSCRVERRKSAVPLLMFDGQHKTVSYWLSGKKTIVVKVYLDFDADSAIRLVNSIQAKIPKLKLSSFELSSKFSEEWRAQFDQYVEEVGEDKASEAGFIKWIKTDLRQRAKAAFSAALVKGVIEHEDLLLAKYIQLAGRPKSESSLLQETKFVNHVVKKLLRLAPLPDEGDEGLRKRERELKMVVFILNAFTKTAFEPAGKGQMTDEQIEIRRRLCFQASLKYFATTMKKVVENIVDALSVETAFTDHDVKQAQRAKISAAVVRFVEHPVWKTELNKTKKLRNVEIALSKNQEIDHALHTVGLTAGYMTKMDDLQSEWFK